MGAACSLLNLYSVYSAHINLHGLGLPPNYIICTELAHPQYYSITMKTPLLVFIPRKGRNIPAMIIELKKGHSAEEALEQIKANDYLNKVSEYTGEMLLVGINYDDKKSHSCVIEKV